MWEYDGSKHFAFFFHLDAHAEATRIPQLRQATQWAKEKISNADIVFFAGDRNFVRSDSERWSSASSVWRPSLRMNATWDEWLSSMGHAYEVVQPEVTWGRVHTDTADHASWIYEIIDVVGSNCKSYSPKGIRCTACRGGDLPHPRTSDHWPVGLRWSGTKKTRKPQHSFDHIVHRPVPPWLLDNAEFQRVADDCFDFWFANRDSGFAGRSSFVGTMYACASTFLSTHIIIATTARQRLELALTTMRLLERHPIDERRLSRLCAADPDLSAIVELHVDLNAFYSISVPPHVLERLAERCRVQADAVLIETPARPDILSDPAAIP